MGIEGRHLWKFVGLAGVVGVAATGALTVRAERKRRAYSPDEVRSQLHARFAQATTAAASERPTVDLTPVRPSLRQRLSHLRRR
ncbi:hypothetical protein [Rhodococcus tukisamuensis]|uniref:Uncharacterized protein n=1 Tax=Rhodococcus tukisamuensis TaxID=168276 RepID=A0A1G6QZB3_9NOCA|nr:hypothetical protein [Rhodococcus tukisamuensis]SDC97729.1 hypothetical protein SAMN05444580_102273 [Rhodococcus tukisamuensis]